MSRVAVNGAAVVLLWVIACGKQKEPDSTVTAAPVASAHGAGTATSSASAPAASDDLARACGDVATALCGKFSTCNSLAMVSVIFDDLAHCTARMKLVCTAELGATDVASTAGDVRACARAIVATPCGDGFDPDAVAECRWKGARVNGKSCGMNAQCTSGFCDKRPPGSECGSCADLPRAGEACPADRCAFGHKCVAPGKCAKVAAIGAPCEGSTPCASGGYCIGRRCVAPAKLGERCDPLARTGPGCAEMVACDVATKACRAPKLANVGETCGLVGAELRPCTRAWCEAHGEQGKCLERARDGDGCVTSEACVVPATCIGGACKLPDPSGCH